MHKTIDEFLLKADQCDLCIIGSGPAGIAVVSKLLKSDLKVVLLESGLKDTSLVHQELNYGRSSGPRELNLSASRLRVFGGAGKLWAGVCRPLGKDEFNRRDSDSLWQWPLNYRELEPYYEESAKLLNIDYGAFFSDSWVHDAELAQQFPELAPSGSLLRGLAFEQSSPSARDLTNKFGSQIIASSNVTLVTDATACDIRATKFSNNSSKVAEILIRSMSGVERKLYSGCTVVAAGALENPRILKTSSLPKNVKGSDFLGGCFMSHPGFSEVGYLHVNDEIRCFDENKIKRFLQNKTKRKYFVFEAATRERRRLKILRHSISLKPLDNARAINKSYIFNSKSKNKTIMDNLKLFEVFKNVGCALKGRTAVPGLWAIGVGIEQEPRLTNKVKLLNQSDQFGIPKIDVFWDNIGQLEKKTILESVKILGRQATSSRTGIVQLSERMLDGSIFNQQDPINHHIGTTRMASRSDLGIVDKDLKVFGIENLYITGSSVFPTSSIVNPTFTIIALSLRLGEKLLSLSSSFRD